MKKSIKNRHAGRIASLFLVLCMVLSIAPVTAFADSPSNPSETHSVNFGSGNWTVGGQTVTADKSGTQELVMDDVITLAGFNADTMQVKLVAEDGFSTTLIVTDGKTSLSKRSNEGGLPNNVTLTFSVVEKGEPGPGPGPEPGPGDEPAHGGYEGEEKTASVTVTGKADFYINDSRMVNANDGDSFDNIEYHYDGNGYVDFYFNCFISERITALTINGEDYYNTLPNPSTEEGKAALLDACKGQLNEFKITVPYSESGYTIVSNVKWLDDSDKDYMVVGNFLWTYEDENQGDDYIDHGRMELIGVKYNGRDYSPSDLSNPGTAKDWGQDESGGGAVLPVGAVVTVKLIPDYGYQLTSFGINGGNFGTGDEQSVFTFEIKPGNAHLGARFTAVEDKVASSSDKVKDGTIELGGEEIDSGSVVLSVDDVALSNEQIANFEETASGYEISSYLDINLDQVVYKGTADDVWTKELKELNNEATITLQLENGVNGNEVVIVHEQHDGTYEIIPTIYNTNTITFKTSSFSNYAIASRVASGQTAPVELIEINNATVSFKAGDKPVFTGTVPENDQYVFRCEWWSLDENTGIVSTEPEWGGDIYNNKITAFEAGKTYHYGVYVTAYTADISPDAKLKINGQEVEYTRIGDESDTQSFWVETDLSMTPTAADASNYKIIEGANGTWTQNSDGTLTFRANGDFSKFTGVKVDGTLIDAKNYTAVSGSTVITLKADYLKTLSGGTHKITVVYTDGECSANFEVKQVASGGKDATSPQTGDNSNLALWFAILFVSGAGVLGITVYSKRKKHME